MAKLHHTKLKAAVALYLSLHTAGANEQEVKAEIAKDEKNYNEEAVNEIYTAILKEPGAGDAADSGGTKSEGDTVDKSDTKGKKKKHIVVSAFRDISDFNTQYGAGDDVSHFDEKRLEALVANKLVEVK